MHYCPRNCYISDEDTETSKVIGGPPDQFHFLGLLSLNGFLGRNARVNREQGLLRAFLRERVIS